MDAQRILQYLRDIAANNNREWFHANKAEYDIVRKDFNDSIAQAIGRITDFDDSIAHIAVKDTVYRFNRDTRFSPDKSPYKRHLGAYICAHGKKRTPRRLLYSLGTRQLYACCGQLLAPYEYLDLLPQ